MAPASGITGPWTSAPLDQRHESLQETRDTAFPAVVIINEKRDPAVLDWPETPSLPIELPDTREI
jgi:hypothetical protein